MKKLFSFTLVLLATLVLVSCAKKRNKAPEISGVKDVTIALNGEFNPLDGVTVTDEDANIQENLQVFGWDNNLANRNGSYEVLYFVQDSRGATSFERATVTVGDASKAPRIELPFTNKMATHTASPDQPFDALQGVKAFNHDNEAIEGVEIVYSNYNDGVEGTYGVTYHVAFENVAVTQVLLLTVKGELPSVLDPNREITIEFAHAMGKANQELLKGYAAEFTAMYPNVTVVIPDTAGNYDDLKKNTMNNILSDTFPSLVQTYPDHVVDYLTTGVVLPLDSYINNNTYGLNGADALEDIVLSYREENRQYDAAGTYFSLPFNKSTEVLVYNKTVVDKVLKDNNMPEAAVQLATWQGVFELAPLLKTYGEDVLKAKQVAPVAYDSIANGFISLSKQWGGQYTAIGADGKGQLLFKDDAKTYEAMEYFKGMGVVTDKNPDGKGFFAIPEFWSQQYASTPFINQQTFITIGSSAGVRHNMPEGKSFIVDTLPVPYNAELPESRTVIQQGTNITILSKNDAQVDLAAWLFLKHLINSKNTTHWAINTGYVPVRETAFNSFEYQAFLSTDLDKQDGSALGAKATFIQRDFMSYDFSFPGSSKARASVGDAFKQIIVGDGNIQGALNFAYSNSLN